ncbi:MAG: hypothetical protein M5U35_05940 [Roseovarius sp.]|nr:hypothetical protein [Roseovarius sp.]
MAKPSPQPGNGGQAKPETRAKPLPTAPRTIPARVFNDFAAI